MFRNENTLLFLFYKNIVFPAQDEYSYFSAYFRLKIFLCIFLDYTERMKPDMTHLTSCRNVISIEHTAGTSVVFVFFLASFAV